MLIQPRKLLNSKYAFSYIVPRFPAIRNNLCALYRSLKRTKSISYNATHFSRYILYDKLISRYIYCATPHSKCPLPLLLTSSPALPRSTWRLPAAARIAHRRYTPALRRSNSSGKLWSLPRLCLCFSSRYISEGNSSCCAGRWGSRSECGVDTSLRVYALSGYTWNFLGVHVLCFKNAVRLYACGKCSWPGVAEWSIGKEVLDGCYGLLQIEKNVEVEVDQSPSRIEQQQRRSGIQLQR